LYYDLGVEPPTSL